MESSSEQRMVFVHKYTAFYFVNLL